MESGSCLRELSSGTKSCFVLFFFFNDLPFSSQVRVREADTKLEVETITYSCS